MPGLASSLLMTDAASRKQPSFCPRPNCLPFSWGASKGVRMATSVLAFTFLKRVVSKIGLIPLCALRNGIALTAWYKRSAPSLRSISPLNAMKAAIALAKAGCAMRTRRVSAVYPIWSAAR
eukprot:2671433-Amphidinium_carterae.1